jgi:hypothetical protein
VDASGSFSHRWKQLEAFEQRNQLLLGAWSHRC